MLACNLTQIDRFALRVLQIDNHISVGSEQLEIEESAQTMTACKIFVLLRFGQIACFVHFVNHQIDLIDARIESSVVSNYGTALFKSVVPKAFIALRSLTTEGCSGVDVAAQLAPDDISVGITSHP